MIEIIIERWGNSDGTTDYLWSIWQQGRRIHMGGKFADAESAETEAREFCRKSLGIEPDRVRAL